MLQELAAQTDDKDNNSVNEECPETKRVRKKKRKS